MSKDLMTIKQILGHNALTYKDKVALYFSDYAEEVTYRDLDERTNKWARYILECGINKGDKVGLIFKDSRKCILGYLALGKLGFIAIPLDPNLSKEDVSRIVSFLDIKNVFIDEQSAPILNEESQNMNVIVQKKDSITSLSEQLSKYSSDSLEGFDASEKDDWIYLNTSGSTGTPKVVRMHHCGYINNSNAVKDHLKIKENDIFFSLTPFYHSHGLYNGVIMPLCCGASSVVLDAFNVFHVPKFWNYVSQFGITIINIVPSILEMIIAMKNKPENSEVQSVRYAICGTAPLKEENRIKFEEFTGIKTVCQYGLTETLINVIELLDGERIENSVGVPVGCKLRIIKDDNKELPANELGEILIEGESVMNGYFGQDIIDGNKGFLTGDLGRIDNDGFLFIEGRNKDIVIKGGKNIFIKDIDRVIEQLPQVKEAISIGLPDEFYGEEIYSFVVLNDGEDQITEEEVINWCREKLIQEYCPKSVIFKDELPKGPTGKVRVKQLKENWLKEAAHKSKC